MTGDNLHKPGRPSARYWLVWLGLSLAAVALSCLLDRSIHEAFAQWRAQPSVKLKPWEIREWYQALRQLGDLRVWIVVGLCLWLIDAGRPSALIPTWSRAGLLVGSAVLAGLLAETIKPLVGRIKPEDSAGNPFSHWPWSMRLERLSDTGFVSSHAAVSMAAATCLAYLFPRCGPVVIAAAIGTGLTRLLVGGHYLSDVVGGMMVGVLAARLMAGWTGVRRLDA